MKSKSIHQRLSIAAVLAAGVITVAACGTAGEEVRSAAPAAAAAPGVAEVYGSSRQLERQARAADALEAEIAAARQRHLELRLAAQAEVTGADRHLELQAAEIASQQQAEVVGSDRHLELRAAELAAGQAPARPWTGPR